MEWDKKTGTCQLTQQEDREINLNTNARQTGDVDFPAHAVTTAPVEKVHGQLLALIRDDKSYIPISSVGNEANPENFQGHFALLRVTEGTRQDRIILAGDKIREKESEFRRVEVTFLPNSVLADVRYLLGALPDGKGLSTEQRVALGLEGTRTTSDRYRSGLGATYREDQQGRFQIVENPGDLFGKTLPAQFEPFNVETMNRAR